MRPAKLFIFRMEFHTTELKKACRVCGKRLNKAKGRERSYAASEYAQQLADTFRIDVSGDRKDTHPLLFCNSCHRAIRHWQTKGGNTPSASRVFMWGKHSGTECTVTTHIFLPVISSW